jgi:hypothetical protein
LQEGGCGAGDGFVQAGDGAEIDLLVEEVLQGGRDVVRVVVVVRGFAVVVVVVVGMVVGHLLIWWRRYYSASRCELVEGDFGRIA